MPSGEEPALRPLDVHNLALLAQVHPPGWRNPAPRKRYNLVVVGGGTAGLVTAVGAAGLGAAVALVERGLLGGDCLNSGCVPSKALLRSARALHDARSLAAFGAGPGAPVEADFGLVMARMRSLRAGLAPADSAARLRSLGVDVFLGAGRFLDRETLEVGGARLAFARACIATGARPRLPDIPGLPGALPLTSENVFWLTERPRRLLVLGGGPIGCELAQAFRRLGSEVTLLSDGDRLLPREEADAAALVAQALRDEGVDLVYGARVGAIERRGGERVISYQDAAGTHERAADELLVAIGRSPNVEGLALERAGVAFDPRQGVQVDDRLRTTNPRIFAAGDICSRQKFTHAADAMARIVIANALFHGRRRVSSLTIPRVTFTDPELGSVGLRSDEPAPDGREISSYTRPFREVDRAVLDGEPQGFARIVAERRSGRILGATVVGRHAGDLLGEVVLAMDHGIPLGAFSAAIHAYPTRADVFQRLGDQRQRERLTPALRALFGRWLAWTR